MQQYHVTLTGLTPLLMHNDNLAFTEKVEAWRNDPGNKEMSVKGDDRSPAWTWLGSLYHDGKQVGIPSDNLMTLLRTAGAKVPTGKNKNETYKKHTQGGIIIDQAHWPIYVNGAAVPVEKLFDNLIGVSDPNRFHEHIEAVERAGFELLVKRAKVGQSKHVRVRPMFREWTAVGSFTVMDPETSGLNEQVLHRIFEQAGAMVGIGDWRPGTSQSPGTFGKFTFDLTPAVAKAA